MKFFRCKRCLYPNTKPDLWFQDGTCSACLAFDARSKIDWEKREREFIGIVSANKGKTHDVIVACSGGKDSTAQIVKCLELGLRPLAVTATTDHLSTIGHENLCNVSRLCDHVTVTPDRNVRNRIARFALLEVGDISWCEHHLIWSVPAREAINRGIPIVLYGENPQNEYGAGPKGSESQTHLTPAWASEFGGLLGLRLTDVSEILEIDPRHLEIYRRPEGNVQCLFMGSYFPWDGYENAQIAKANGFEEYPVWVEGSMYGYENLDNYQTGIHDFLRFRKFGFSRACDIASSHIRRGRLDRDFAGELVHTRDVQPFQGYLGKPLKEILGNIDVSMDEWNQVVERFTNVDLVKWALHYGSFRSFYDQMSDASKADNSTEGASLVA